MKILKYTKRRLNGSIYMLRPAARHAPVAQHRPRDAPPALPLLPGARQFPRGRVQPRAAMSFSRRPVCFVCRIANEIYFSLLLLLVNENTNDVNMSHAD